METVLELKFLLFCVALLAFIRCAIGTRTDIGEAGAISWFPVAGGFASIAAGICWGHLWSQVVAVAVFVPLILWIAKSLSNSRSIGAAPIVREYTRGNWHITEYFSALLVGRTAKQFWTSLLVSCVVLLVALIAVSFVDLVTFLILKVGGEKEVNDLKEILDWNRSHGFLSRRPT